MSKHQVPPRPERPNGDEPPGQRAKALWDFMDRIDRKFDRVHDRIDKMLYLLLGIFASGAAGLTAVIVQIVRGSE